MFNIKIKLDNREQQRLIKELELTVYEGWQKAGYISGMDTIKDIKNESLKPKTGRFYKKIRYGKARNQVKNNHTSGNSEVGETSARLSGKKNRNTKFELDKKVLSFFVNDTVEYASVIEKRYKDVEKGVERNLDKLIDELQIQITKD